MQIFIMEVNEQYDKLLLELCQAHRKTYPHILTSKKYVWLWDYVLSCTQILQDKEKETGHKFKVSTYVNWTLNHRTEFGKCKMCGKVFDTYDMNFDADYKMYCSQACLNKSADHIQHVADTLEAHYGERIPARVPEVMQKMQSTCLKLYGVKNCWQLPKVKEICNDPKVVKRRLASLKAYNQEHYGVDWFVQSDEFKQMTNSVGGVSKEEKQLVEWLKSFLCESDLQIGTFKVIPPRQLDVYIVSCKLGIEFNGTYYHSIEHNIDINYHLMKTKMCEDAGVKLVHIWEDEWIYQNEHVKTFVQKIIDGTMLIEGYLIQREDGLFEIDRSKFNKCCISSAYEVVDETKPQVILRSKASKDKYRVADCGKLILKKLH